MEEADKKDTDAIEDATSVQTPPSPASPKGIGHFADVPPSPTSAKKRRRKFPVRKYVVAVLALIACAVVILAFSKVSDETTPGKDKRPDERPDHSTPAYQSYTSARVNLTDICLGLGMTPTKWAFVVGGGSNATAYAIDNFKVDRVARIDERIFLTLAGDAIDRNSKSTNSYPSSLRFSFGLDFSQGIIRPANVKLERFRVYDSSGDVPGFVQKAETDIQSFISDMITNLSYKTSIPDNCEIRSIRFMTDDTISISFKEVPRE